MKVINKMAGVAAAVLALTVCVAVATPVQQAQATTVSGAKVVTTNGKWAKQGNKMFYYVGAHKARTLCNIGSDAYLFSKKGVQKTGWRKYKGSYYYFTPSNGKSGSMVAGKIVNGVQLGGTGKAIISNNNVKAELKVFVKAQKTVDSLAKPAASKATKLRKSFDYLTSSSITEKVLHSWTSSGSWWLMFAKDVLYKKAGDCYSMGCAMAYLANACGYTKVEAISSGGHGWARVDGKYYDPEWSRHSANTYFGVPGKYKDMNYEENCTYVCNLTRTKIWPGTGGTSSTKGLVKQDGDYYFFDAKGNMVTSEWRTVKGKKYFFRSSGRAVKGSVRIKGVWYVFGKNATLLTGSGTRVQKVLGVKYRIDSKGRGVGGWSGNSYYQPSGAISKGICFVEGKLCAFNAKGVYNATKSAKLENARVIGSDATKLLKLMGEPLSKKTSESCNQMKGPDGVVHGGTDAIYTYANVKVWTFIADDESFEYLIDVA